uniref:Uncharacterized protein n=1 Tax=Oryza brachyantha TaxID=4533 RepID=J3MWW3_ORYBR
MEPGCNSLVAYVSADWKKGTSSSQLFISWESQALTLYKDNATSDEQEKKLLTVTSAIITRHPNNLLSDSLVMGLFKGLTELPKQSGAPRVIRPHPCPGSSLIAGRFLNFLNRSP